MWFYTLQRASTSNTDCLLPPAQFWILLYKKMVRFFKLFHHFQWQRQLLTKSLHSKIENVKFSKIGLWFFWGSLSFLPCVSRSISCSLLIFWKQNWLQYDTWKKKKDLLLIFWATLLRRILNCLFVQTCYFKKH